MTGGSIELPENHADVTVEKSGKWRPQARWGRVLQRAVILASIAGATWGLLALILCGPAYMREWLDSLWGHTALAFAWLSIPALWSHKGDPEIDRGMRIFYGVVLLVACCAMTLIMGVLWAIKVIF